MQRVLRDEEARQRKKPADVAIGGLLVLAEWTGLEPATPGVTGRYSNQLNYHSLARWLSSPPPRANRLLAARADLASPRGFEPLYSP